VLLASVLLSATATAQLVDSIAIDAAVQRRDETWQVSGAADAIVTGDRVAHMKDGGPTDDGSGIPEAACGP
jgi:hypothetical protein